MKRRQALIVGAGYVGGAVARKLSSDGWRVWALTRSRQWEAPIHGLRVDLGDDAAVQESFRSAAFGPRLDVVVFAVSADERTDAAYRTAYVTGLQNVLRALADVQLGRLIIVSSTGVFAQENGEQIDEASPAIPEHFSGRRLLESEQLARAATAQTSIVRLGGIYGPERTRLRDLVRGGRAFASLDAPRYQNRVHRDDAAGFLAHLAAMEAEPQALYLGVDDEPADLRAVQAWFCQRLGKKPSSLESSALRPRPVGKRCLNTLLKASGYVLRYPSFKEGYASLPDA
ncbi:MAG: NAD-dependent epimerase/dehydratase family protein [Polyangiaceae bacterium]